MNKIQLHTYVLVYPLYPGNPSGPKHCVYADNLDPRTRNIECINSDPDDPYPDIPISRKGNVLYRVSCTASEMTLGHVTSPGHRAPVTTGTVRMREKPPRKPSDNSSQNKRYSSPCNRYNQGIQGKMNLISFHGLSCHARHAQYTMKPLDQQFGWVQQIAPGHRTNYHEAIAENVWNCTWLCGAFLFAKDLRLLKP